MPKEKWVVEYDEKEDAGRIAYYDNGWKINQDIQFQHGPIGDNGINGIQNEELIELLIKRLRSLNVRLSCRENSLAITKLEEALLWLGQRTLIRQVQGVEGTNQPHG